MSDEKPICGTCHFFDAAPLAGTPAKNGVCRVNAPTPNAAKPWPVVQRTDWCGEHPAFHTEIQVVSTP